MRSITRRKIYFLTLSLFVFTLFNLNISTLFAVTETVTVSATVTETTTSAPSSPTSSGGRPPASSLNGNQISIPKTSIRLSGEAYPNSKVTLLKNGLIVATVRSDNEGLFSVTLEEKYTTANLYTVFVTDVFGKRSSVLNYPIVVSEGYLTHLSGIRFPPTTILDKIQVRFEDSVDSEDSSLGIVGDFDGDERINQVDFSMLAFWYKKDNPRKSFDINKDGIVDLIDFSILAFYWTN